MTQNPKNLLLELPPTQLELVHLDIPRHGRIVLAVLFNQGHIYQLFLLALFPRQLVLVGYLGQSLLPNFRISNT
jgi:hypothetical protein